MLVLHIYVSGFFLCENSRKGVCCLKKAQKCLICYLYCIFTIQMCGQRNMPCKNYEVHCILYSLQCTVFVEELYKSSLECNVEETLMKSQYRVQETLRNVKYIVQETLRIVKYIIQKS